MAEPYDDNPFAAPGFNYSDVQRPLDEPSRYDDFGIKSPEEAQMDGNFWTQNWAIPDAPARPLLSRQDSLSFSDWQQQYGSAQGPSSAFGSHDPSMTQGLSMAGAMQALAERIRSLFRGQNYEQGMDR